MRGWGMVTYRPAFASPDAAVPAFPGSVVPDYQFRVSISGFFVYGRGARFELNTSRSSLVASSPLSASLLVISVP